MVEANSKERRVSWAAGCSLLSERRPGMYLGTGGYKGGRSFWHETLCSCHIHKCVHDNPTCNLI